MGTSTNAILAYGYDLGGGDDEWRVAQVDDDGFPQVDWIDADAEDDVDFPEAAIDHLRVAAGFTETDWRADGYFDRQKAIDEQIGVEFETYCSADYSSYLLAAKAITVRRGDCKILDLAALQAEVETNGYDAKLRAACEVLGITPTQEKPSWLLVSYWG